MEFVKSIKTIFQILKKTFSGFMDDKAMKLSASLSYYTVFSLGPVLVIIFSVVSLAFGKAAVEGKVYAQIKDLVGESAALQVQEIIASVKGTHATTTGAIIGFVALFIGATGVFTEMQSSINFIWSVRAKPKKGWLKFIINRLLSFSLVLGLGFLLLVSLIVNALLTLLNQKLLRRFPDFNPDYFHAANTIIIIAIISLLFAVIYKILPDAVISWKDAWIGSLFTAILFLLGKFIIGYYLGKANLGVTYGAAASVVIILTWVYYSAVILYFGAEFTKIYALHSGEGIRPKPTAVFIIKKESREVPASYLDT